MFLMNDALLELGGGEEAPPPGPERLRALTLAHVLKLGAEVYSDEPLLHREDPARARRLALLILAKSPGVNAAHFGVPARGCPPADVTVRLASVSLDVLSTLRAKAAAGALTPASADSEVWRRMAA